MAHHYAFMMKVVAEQELESPSFTIGLRGRKGQASESPAKAAKKAAQMPTKPKKAKPDVGRLTLELEGAC